MGLVSDINMINKKNNIKIAAAMTFVHSRSHCHCWKETPSVAAETQPVFQSVPSVLPLGCALFWHWETAA